jgi:hypothetical protein
MHCTDVKRETMYIKEHDEWSKQNSRDKLKSALNIASIKNYHALKEWYTENPEFMDNEKKADFYARTIVVLGGALDKVNDKIIRNLCNNVKLEKDEQC